MRTALRWMCMGVIGVGMWIASSVPLIARAQAASCQFMLGFQTLHSLDPSDSGDCVNNQYLGNPNGDQWQNTTKGLMVWRKADNWTAFTNGYMTWINGPTGMASRLNTQRFSWEGDAGAPGTVVIGAVNVASDSNSCVPPLGLGLYSAAQADQLRRSDPDVYLNNYIVTNGVPSNSGFSVSKEFSFRNGHYYPTVTLLGSDENASKAAFVGWLRSICLTDAQVSQLDAQYFSATSIGPISQAVGALKRKLPYYYDAVAVLYDKDLDLTTVVISARNRAIGEQELQSFLQANGVADETWINNLNVKYQ